MQTCEYAHFSMSLPSLVLVKFFISSLVSVKMRKRDWERLCIKIFPWI